MLKVCEKQGCHKARPEVLENSHKAIGSFRQLDLVQEGHLCKDEEKKDTVIIGKIL